MLVLLLLLISRLINRSGLRISNLKVPSSDKMYQQQNFSMDPSLTFFRKLCYSDSNMQINFLIDLLIHRIILRELESSLNPVNIQDNLLKYETVKTTQL